MELSRRERTETLKDYVAELKEELEDAEERLKDLDWERVRGHDVKMLGRLYRNNDAKPARRRNFSVFFDTCRQCAPRITPDRRSALTY